MKAFALANALLIVVACGTGAAWAQQAAAPVVVAEIVEQKVSGGRLFVGTVLPSRQSLVGSAVDGRVAEFSVVQGDFVHKGQTLAQLMTDTMALEVQGAEAELRLKEEELKELENGLRPEEIEQAQATMLAAKAGMDYQQARRKRADVLFERQAANQDEVQLVMSEAIRAEQTYQEANAAYKLAIAGTRPEKITQARARMEVQRALVDKLKDQLKKHTIVAPFDGYVIAEHTEVGQWVKQGDLVAEIAALDEVDVEAHLLADHLPFVRIGAPVRVEIDALPGELLTGSVYRLIPQAELKSRTFPVKIRVKNTLTQDGPLLSGGMLARVIIPVGSDQPALLVPKDALVLGGATPVVFVVEPSAADAKQAQVRAVPVELGVASDLLIEVKGGGLQKGQRVVVRGNERLQPNQTVIVSELSPSPTTQAKTTNPDEAD